MKGIYWRPRHVSRNVLVLIALLAVAGIGSVELFQQKVKQKYFRSKIRAAKHMKAGMDELKRFRQELGIPIDNENDPAGSGIIGLPISPITSNSGSLESKQTTINPNFAAVSVHLLKRAGVEKGDIIAVGLSGSFPGVNLAVLSACETLELNPIIVTSAAGSEWGGNIPGFTWLEMEKRLFDAGLIRSECRSIAASVGGVEDKGRGMASEGRKLLKKVIKRANIPLLWPRNAGEGVEERMSLYEEHAGDRPIKAYINVGGGTISVGTAYGKRLFKPGLNRSLPPAAHEIDSIMVRFAQQGVPVIHLTKIKDLAERYGLPMMPQEMPKVGQGNIYFKTEYNLWLVFGLLVSLVVFLWLLVRLNLADRFAAGGKSKKDSGGLPEPMV